MTFDPACMGKTAHETQRCASIERDRILRRGRARKGMPAGGHVDVYRCRSCNHWHVGNWNYGRKAP